MRKTIFISMLLFVSLCIGNATAQNVRLGVKAGYNSAKWRGETVSAVSDLTNSSQAFSISSKPGFYAGIYTQIPIGEKLVFEPGLYYSQKGVTVSFTYPGENILKFIKVKADLINHAHYIDLPLYFKYNITEKIFAYGGPQVSYLFANEVQGKAGVLGLSAERKFDLNNVFNKWDFSLSGGVGVNLTPKLNINVGYEYGLIKLDNTVNAEIYNRVIKAGLGYTF